MRITPLHSLIVFSILNGGCLCASDPGNLVPRTADQDPGVPAIDINGIRVHAETFGTPGNPIILALHGGPGVDYRSMLPLQALANDGYYVVFFDQRGTGLTQRVDPSKIDLDLYLEDLRQVIEHYTSSPDQPIVFIGHSWGAMYLTAFIDKYGDYGGRIRGAVLSEPGAFTKKQLDAFLDRYIGTVSLVGEQFNDAVWAEQFISPADHERADYMQAMMAMQGLPAEHHDPNNPTPFWRHGAVVNHRLLEIANRGFDWTQHLGAFTHPVLFLRGDLNEACTLESQQEMAAAYPHATIQTMQNTGHEMIWEHSEEYLTDVRAYLGGLQ